MPENIQIFIFAGHSGRLCLLRRSARAPSFSSVSLGGGGGAILIASWPPVVENGSDGGAVHPAALPSSCSLLLTSPSHRHYLVCFCVAHISLQFPPPFILSSEQNFSSNRQPDKINLIIQLNIKTTTSCFWFSLYRRRVICLCALR